MENDKELLLNKRNNMKSAFKAAGMEPDQRKGLPQPPLFKEAMGGKRIALVRDFQNVVQNNSYLELVSSRKSSRAYLVRSLSLISLSFLLWSAQGVKSEKTNATFRTVPSGGARHPLETYLAVRNVEGVEPGLYHYLPQTHELECIRLEDDIDKKVVPLLNNQRFAGEAAVTLFFAAVPYRCEWRYAASAQKLILIDAGHVVQNVYLSCQAMNLGTCAIASYDQEACDAFWGLDGTDEFIVYIAPVGHV